MHKHFWILAAWTASISASAFAGPLARLSPADISPPIAMVRSMAGGGMGGGGMGGAAEGGMNGMAGGGMNAMAGGSAASIPGGQRDDASDAAYPCIRTQGHASLPAQFAAPRGRASCPKANGH